MNSKDVLQKIMLHVSRSPIYRRVCHAWNKWLSADEFVEKWEQVYVFRVHDKSQMSCKLTHPNRNARYIGDYHNNNEPGVVEYVWILKGRIMRTFYKIYTWVYEHKKEKKRRVLPQCNIILIQTQEDNTYSMYSQFTRYVNTLRNYAFVMSTFRIFYF